MADEEPDLGADFPGSDYDHELDHARLTGQLLRVYTAMADGEWRTLAEICAITGDQLDASISKQLRHLRYRRFGAYTVEKRRRGDEEAGLWEYRVGAKGSHTPRKPALLIRAEAAEAMAAVLAAALRAVDPDNKALRQYARFTGHVLPRRIIRTPRSVPKPRHGAEEHPPTRPARTGRTRGASSTGTGRTHEERMRAIAKNHAE